MSAVNSTDWSRDASCRGQDPAIWFPLRASEQESHGTQAKRICQACPVRTDCLDHAVTHAEMHGIWGGAGGLILGWLRTKRRYRTHDGYRPDCRCGYCTAVRRHFRDLDEQSAAPIDRNGPGATHGKRSTYARGHRCPRCRFAVSVSAQRVRRAGWEIPDWWDHTFGPEHGLDPDDPDAEQQLRAAINQANQALEIVEPDQRRRVS